MAAVPPDEPQDFDLPAVPLSQALLEIGQRWDVLMSFPPSLVDGRMAPPLKGRFTLRQVLEQVTQPSGLVVNLTAVGAVNVSAAPLPAVEPQAGATARLPAAVLPRTVEPVGDAVLPPVEIFGSPRQSDGLRALRGWSATRIDAPIADLPQQVSVLTHDSLSLQGNSNSIESTRYIAGVVLSRGIVFGSQGPGGDDGNILNGVMVRGMNASLALSGMRTVRSFVPIDNAFIERIEVVKGPTGVLSGVADYGGRGGQVNLVRKEAVPDAHTEVTQSLSVQDGGTLRVGADLGGALRSGTDWRLIGYGQTTGTTEGGYVRQYGGGVLGSMTHRDGDFTAAVTLQVDRQRIAPAAASLGGVEQRDGSFTPVERGVRTPVDPSDRALVSTADLQIDLAWRLGADWRATWKGRLEAVSNDSRLKRQSGFLDYRVIEPRDANIQAGLERTWVLGETKHQVSAGLDLERWRFTEIFRDQNDLTVLNYEYRQALMLQDLVSAGPWRVRLAVQHGRIPERVRMGGNRDRTSEPLPATNWDAGVLYRWSPELSVYGGTQSSIETDNRRAGLISKEGTEPPDTLLRQTQVGLKSELLEGRVALTLEAFRMRETNRLIGTPGVNLTSVPGLSIDGAEFELSGRPHPALDVYFGMALLTGMSQNHSELGYAPGHSMRLLGRYRLPDLWALNTSVGVAAMANSYTRVYGFNRTNGEPYLRLPGGARIDLSLERKVGLWSINAALNNVFDRQFYGTVSDPRAIPVLPGRSASVTATFRD